MATGRLSLKPFDVNQFKRELTNEVRKRPLLYNAEDPAYKDKNAVEDAWNEVVDTLDPECNHDLTIDFAKKHWKALRDDFFRRNKKLENKEVSRDKVLKWPLFHALEFLRAHYKRPAKTGTAFNQSPIPPSLPTQLPEHNVIIERPKESPPKTGAAKRKASIKSVLKKRKRPRLERMDDWGGDDDGYGDDNDDDDVTLLSHDLDATNNNISAKDCGGDRMVGVEGNASGNGDVVAGGMTFAEEEHFARSIAATLRRFDPKVRSLAKARIQQLLFDLEFGAGGDGKDAAHGHVSGSDGTLHMYAGNE